MIQFIKSYLSFYCSICEESQIVLDIRFDEHIEESTNYEPIDNYYNINNDDELSTNVPDMNIDLLEELTEFQDDISTNISEQNDNEIESEFSMVSEDIY